MARSKERMLGLPDDIVLTVMDLENNIRPPYLQNKNTWKMYSNYRASIEYASMLSRVAKQIESLQNTKHWKVMDVDHNQWKTNKVDERLLYGLNEDILQEPEPLPPTSRGHSPELDYPRENTDLKVEKSFIYESQARQRSPVNMAAKRLMSQTMREFKKPVETPQSPYCKPQNFYLEDGVKPDTPKHPYQVVKNFPMGITRWVRRHPGTICHTGKDGSISKFCDTLGPYSCQKCIEITNRKIITEIQKESFPTLEFSLNNLVAPKLAKQMKIGEMMMGAEPPAPGESVKKILPHISSAKFKDFRRPGMEQTWYERSRTFHSRNDELANDDEAEGNDWRAKSTMSGSKLRRGQGRVRKTVGVSMAD